MKKRFSCNLVWRIAVLGCALTAGICRGAEPAEPEISGAYVLTGRVIRVFFDLAENGFNCLSIENAAGKKPVRFVRARPGTAGFWTIVFTRPGEEIRNGIPMNNLSRSVRTAESGEGKITFHWNGLNLPGEPGVVDVSAEVRINPAGDAAEWRLSVTNRSRGYGLSQTSCPDLTGVAPDGLSTALLPYGNWGGTLVPRFEKERKKRMHYPGIDCPVQTLAFLLDGAGLQVTALDGKAQEKTFLISTNVDVKVEYLCPDGGMPGNARAADYAVETAVFTGDWWGAARRYREWALRQEWAEGGPLSKRKDVPQKLVDIGYWSWFHAGTEATNMMKQIAEALPGIPIATHWHRWHKTPFDTAYPELFPSPGIREAVAWMMEQGMVPMLYTNGRLWDNGLPSFPKKGFPNACKKPGGKVAYTEVYGHSPKFSPMCPATRLWQDTIVDLVGRVIGELGTDAVFIDQIAAAAPAACYDPAHGHSIGGGGYWTAGYRAMLRRVRKVAYSKGAFITTECGAEPYLDSVDGFLTYLPRYAGEVPFLPAVYSGYTVYFSNPQPRGISLDSFCAAEAVDFLWGSQPGGENTWLFDPKEKDKVHFLAMLCRERLAHKDYFVYGRLLGETTPITAEPVRQYLMPKNFWMPDRQVEYPPVVGAAWLDGEGKNVGVFLVNMTAEPHSYSFRADPAWGIPSGLQKLELPPRSVRNLVFQANPAPRP